MGMVIACAPKPWVTKHIMSISITKPLRARLSFQQIRDKTASEAQAHYEGYKARHASAQSIGQVNQHP
jgi:hypothetical protein